jgi:hypothetical protein
MHNANSIPLTPVASSQLAAIGHDPATKTLAIQFLQKGQPGNVYHYTNFTVAEFSAFASAESAGSHFGKHIKPHAAKHPFTNMGVPAAPEPAAAPLSKEMLAMVLHGRQYGSEITEEEEAAAKAAGLLVIFGASDDLMEFRGAAHDEIYCHGGGTALIDAAGVLPNRDDVEDDVELKALFVRQPLAASIKALSCAEEDFAWTYETAVPHATFEIHADGGQYCRGIVISVADLAPAAA